VLSLVARERVTAVIAAVEAVVREAGVPGRVLELPPTAEGTTLIPELATSR
jgi:hypothetical protein